MATQSIPLTLRGMLEELEERSSAIPNDERQENYCRYINIVTENYGDERVHFVGSTPEGTHLRTDKNEGDYDYLLVSGINIPVELLEYRKDVPCFVHIDGRSLQKKLKVNLVDEKYLPSAFLKTLCPEAFTIIRGIHEIVTKPTTSKGRHTFHVSMKVPNKLGVTLEEYDSFECDLTPDTEKPRTRGNGKHIQEMFQRCCQTSDILRANQELGPENSVTDVFSKLLNFAQDIRPSEDPESLIYENYGNLTSALSVDESGKRPGNDDQNNLADLCKKPRLSVAGGTSAKQQCESQDAMDTSEPTPCSSTTEDDNSCKLDTNQSEEEILVRFQSKSHKDFTGASRLLGTPRGFDDKLRQRLGKWLTPQQINDIFDSEFYVVGKPAVTNPKDEIDFCLSYNQAELKLAKAMSRGQRRCILMLKAFQRSALVEFSEILTTFHWKTALYWKSEELDPILFSDDLILEALKSILEYMIDCLCNRNLQHYFIESNLFAGMDEDTAMQIAEKVIAICEDPIAALRHFFEREKNFYGTFQTEKMPRSKLEDIRKLCYEAKDESDVQNFTSALSDLARAIPTSEEKRPGQRDFSEVLMSVASVAFQDMLKEQAREAENKRQEEARNLGKLFKNVSVPSANGTLQSQQNNSNSMGNASSPESSQPNTENERHDANETIMNLAEAFLGTVPRSANLTGENSTENILGDLRDYLSTPQGNRRERRERREQLKQTALSLFPGLKK